MFETADWTETMETEVYQKSCLQFTSDFRTLSSIFILTCYYILLPACTVSSCPLEMRFTLAPPPSTGQNSFDFTFSEQVCRVSLSVCVQVCLPALGRPTRVALWAVNHPRPRPFWVSEEDDWMVVMIFLFLLFFLERCNTPPFCLFNISLIWQ